MANPTVPSQSIRPGICCIPGNPESNQTAASLLAKDCEAHHCFWGPANFHNHLSHHILAAYDLGASSEQLEGIYAAELGQTRDIQFLSEDSTSNAGNDLRVTENDWLDHLGDKSYYSAYLKFFATSIQMRGVKETVELYVFSANANDSKGRMLCRVIGGALHPLIQLGYAIEFKSDAMVAQALAQAAVHAAFYPQAFDFTSTSDAKHVPLFAVLQQAYSLPTLAPVMPYDPDAFISARFAAAFNTSSGVDRAKEVRRLSSLWMPSDVLESGDRDIKLEELFFVNTLLFAGTSKPGRAVRLDFFLMHVLNATVFLPSILPVLVPSSRAQLLRAMFSTTLSYMLIRGRPRINPSVLMSYTAHPGPPASLAPQNTRPNAHESALGKPEAADASNPWLQIIQSVVHAPDAHTLKAVRMLYYAAGKYSYRIAGEVGVVDGEEMLDGIRLVDGTIFIRAAGAVMDTLGWVSHGQPPGSWDRSGLGWDDAWSNGE